jgi:hypothetical protein
MPIRGNLENENFHKPAAANSPACATCEADAFSDADEDICSTPDACPARAASGNGAPAMAIPLRTLLGQISQLRAMTLFISIFK